MSQMSPDNGTPLILINIINIARSLMLTFESYKTLLHKCTIKHFKLQGDPTQGRELYCRLAML